MSAGDDGLLKAWRLSGGAVLRSLLAHSSKVVGGCYAEHFLVSAGRDHTVNMWEVAPPPLARPPAQMSEATLLASSIPVLAVGTAAAGAAVVETVAEPTSSDAAASPSNPSCSFTHLEQRPHQHHGSITAIACVPASCSPCSSSAPASATVAIATASRDGTVKLWDQTGSFCLHTLHGLTLCTIAMLTRVERVIGLIGLVVSVGLVGS